MKACGGIFNVVVDRLKERGRAEAHKDRCDAVVEDKINKFLVNTELFSIEHQNAERGENADSDHDAIHMHV